MKRTFNIKRALILVCIPIALVVLYLIGYPVGVFEFNYLSLGGTSNIPSVFIAFFGIVFSGILLAMIGGTIILLYLISKTIFYLIPKSLYEWLFPKQDEK